MEPRHSPLFRTDRARSVDRFVIVERLIANLPHMPYPAQRITLVLEAVRMGTGADLVIWEPGLTRELPQSVGSGPLPPGWCRNFLCQQEELHPDSTLHLEPRLNLGAGEPHSAALVRVSKSRSAWIVALTFHPAHVFESADLKLLSLVRRVLLQDRQRAHGQDAVQSILLALVRSLTAAIGANDSYTGEHSERVGRMARRLGQEMGLSPAVQNDLYLAGLLHDIGKIGIHSSVLKESGRLSPEQREQIEQHPVIGDRILATVPSLARLRPAVLHHHEHFNGAGYPDHLAQDNIPLSARILAVADACDAMYSARPYRPGRSSAEVTSTLLQGAGTQWDPLVVSHFMTCREDLFAIHNKGLGHSVLMAVADLVRSAGTHLENSTVTRRLG